MKYQTENSFENTENTFIFYFLAFLLIFEHDLALNNVGRYSQEVTKLETANLVTCFMEHRMLTHSLHFNDYKSGIK